VLLLARDASKGTGKFNLHRYAGGVLLRTRSSSGNLRLSRKQVPRSRFWYPTGFCWFAKRTTPYRTWQRLRPDEPDAVTVLGRTRKNKVALMRVGGLELANLIADSSGFFVVFKLDREIKLVFETFDGAFRPFPVDLAAPA
jgi:hypothetical protein